MNVSYVAQAPKKGVMVVPPCVFTTIFKVERLTQGAPGSPIYIHLTGIDGALKVTGHGKLDCMNLPRDWEMGKFVTECFTAYQSKIAAA